MSTAKGNANVAGAHERRCRYGSKRCENPRAIKRNGELHRFCEYHRERANLNQKKNDQKKKGGSRKSESDEMDDDEQDAQSNDKSGKHPGDESKAEDLDDDLDDDDDFDIDALDISQVDPDALDEKEIEELQALVLADQLQHLTETEPEGRIDQE